MSDKNAGDLIFKYVEKPRGYYGTKSFNVYDNRHRVNVYVQTEDDGLTKVRMYNSYFVTMNEKQDALTILDSGVPLKL